MASKSVPGEKNKEGPTAPFRIVLTHEQWMRIGEAYFRHGLLKRDRRSFKEAAFAFRRAEGMAPADRFCWLARAYGELARCSILPLRIGYLFFSRIYLYKALKSDRHHAFSYYVLGLWYQRMPKWAGGRPEKMLAHLDRAISLEADQILFRLAKMRWLLKNDLQEAALQECRRIVGARSTGPDDDRRKIEAGSILEQHQERRKLRRPDFKGNFKTSLTK